MGYLAGDTRFWILDLETRLLSLDTQAGILGSAPGYRRKQPHSMGGAARPRYEGEGFNKSNYFFSEDEQKIPHRSTKIYFLLNKLYPLLQLSMIAEHSR